MQACTVAIRTFNNSSSAEQDNPLVELPPAVHAVKVRMPVRHVCFGILSRKLERTLVKSLHTGEPDVMGLHTHEYALSCSDYILVKSMCHELSLQ
jgi:hypothetical protein